MCSGNKPTPITITISSEAADPCSAYLSDGKHSGSHGGGKEFTTEVVSGQTISFKTSGDIEEITAITEGPGSDIFSIDPSPKNNWTGVIGSLPAGDTREYTISYSMKGKSGEVKILCSIDPKLQMKR